MDTINLPIKCRRGGFSAHETFCFNPSSRCIFVVPMCSTSKSFPPEAHKIELYLWNGL